MKIKFLSLILVLNLGACGYTLRGNSRPFFARYGIKTLYIPPVRNDSYKAGAEITIYNALRKKLAEGGYVSIIDDAKLSDAKFSATVVDASYAPLAITTADQIGSAAQVAPLVKGPTTVQIASSYNVTFTVRFLLEDSKGGKRLWTDTLTRQKSFVATTYIGTLGSTSALINDSDFERSLSELSIGLVGDAEELINSIF